MKSLFKRTQSPQPFLAPLAAAGRLSRVTRLTLDGLPPAAAPVAVTVVGGVLLLVVLGMLLGRTPPDTEPVEAPVASQEEAAPAQAPQVAIAQAPHVQEEEESAALVAADLATAQQLVPPPDHGQTASILQAMPSGNSFQPIVPVAETEDEITALEEAQRSALVAEPAPPPSGATAPTPPETTASVQPQSTPKRPAIATRYVNLRAAPNDDADVLLVVPALAEIEAQDDCRWCEVTYDGRVGYLFTSFIEYKG